MSGQVGCPVLLHHFLYSILKGWRPEGDRSTQPSPLPSAFGEKWVAVPGKVRARGVPWTIRAAVRRLPDSAQGATQPPPLPPFRHPTLGTKDFKFWLRRSSRGRQTSIAGKPGPRVTGHPRGASTHARAHILLHSFSGRQAAALGGRGGVSQPGRGSPGGSLGGLTSV